MNEALKQFSDDVAAKLKAALASQSVEEFVKTVKASGDDRTFEVVMSTSDEDRQGDSLDQSRWDLKYYTMNPVVLWAHNYQGFPIGVVTDIEIQGNKAVATGKFAPAGLNPEADMACALYQAKVLRAVSPGYIQNDDGTRELLEVSFCPVPAGRYALSLRQVTELGMSTRELVTKGFFYETKGAVPYHDYGEADPDAAWDAAAEEKACGDDIETLKSISTWFDSENSDVKSAYQLPHHRASDRKAVWKGVAAAGAALQGGRGGVAIPEGDLAAVKAHLAKHYAAFGKTPPWEEKSEQSAQAGGSCELEDGTPGILADDPTNPGSLVCIPSKSTKSESMNNDLDKKFTTEHERHGKAFAKAIDEFKSVDEFQKAVDGEQEEHLSNTMKAIDEGYELEDQKKSIDEFKSEMKAEHLTHVKAVDKAIDEFKSAHESADEDGKTKVIEEFTKAVGDELDRHEKAHKAMCEAEFGEGEDNEKKFYDWRQKGAVAEELAEDQELQSKYQRLDRAFDIFYAFASAYLDEKTAVADFEKLLDEAVGLMKMLESKATGILAVKMKSGRAISAKNRNAIEQVIKAIDDHHTEHGKHSDEITAALKAIMASGDGGEEPSNGEEPNKKALNSRSSTSGASAELETYLFTQRLVRQVKTASEGALRQINDKIKEARTSGR